MQQRQKILMQAQQINEDRAEAEEVLGEEENVEAETTEEPEETEAADAE